jgi:acetoin utilization deacetylase AcuC-like enzyme
MLDKYACVLAALRDSGVRMTVHEPDSMPPEWIIAVHDPDYVDQVLSAAVPREKERRIGYAVTAEIARRSRLTVGGTWLAARLALRHGFATMRLPIPARAIACSTISSSQPTA